MQSNRIRLEISSCGGIVVSEVVVVVAGFFIVILPGK
jgi:hypothetical protein